MSKLSKDIRTMHGDWCANALEAAERRAEELAAQFNQYVRGAETERQELERRVAALKAALQGLLDWYNGKPASSLGPHMTRARELLTASRPSTTEGDA